MSGERDIVAGERAAGRLSAAEIAQNFADLHPPLTPHKAAIEASRCYFCFDAPCVDVCPTGIDIPSFIHKISTGNLKGSARTILEANIFGAMCARVCPTEVLCEGVCVRNTGESKPVEIGALQRVATDHVIDSGIYLFERGEPTGKRVAVLGAGPAGISCAHGLAVRGHAVTVFDTREKPGGLNEYGIAAYKVVDDIAQREIDYILAVGGIEMVNGSGLQGERSLDRLRADFDAVFLGLGLEDVNGLSVEGEDTPGVRNAVDYIAELRQADDLTALPVADRVVVIGGGMTAIDIACQAKKLGAEDVTIVYRRGPEDMGASKYEQDLAQTTGVRIRHWAQPNRIVQGEDQVSAIDFERTRYGDGGKLEGTGETYTLSADMVFKAVGQRFDPAVFSGAAEAPELTGGRIQVDAERRTSLTGVWAGGDCVAGGLDLTVAAVEDGKQAARSIDEYLRGDG